MEAIILSVGDELVLGQSLDTNSAYLSGQLARLGIGTLYHQTLSDDRRAIAGAITAAAQAAERVIITGGLGPTDDDLTRQALADAMNAPLVQHEPSLDALAAFFAQCRRPMPEKTRVQAMHPQGTQMLTNTCGTAPGIRAKLHRAVIYAIPGVPNEMVAMFEQSIRPEIEAGLVRRAVILTTRINTFGLGESTVAQKLGELMDRPRNPQVGTTTADGIISVRVRSRFDDPNQAQRELERTVTQIDERLGPIVFGRDEQSLQQSAIALLQQRGLRVATAESCTGGLLGKMLTDVAGSSAVYVGGWVTYTNRLKSEQLGVDQTLVTQYGAVSEPVVRAMAAGAIERSGADLSLAITGIAGPDGGTPEKPVGTVWIALGDAGRVEAYLFHLPGSRQAVRDRAAKTAVQLLRYRLLNAPVDLLCASPTSRQ